MIVSNASKAVKQVMRVTGRQAVVFGMACLGFSQAADAAMVVIEDEVSGFSNLFYSDWGHDYNQPFALIEDPEGSGNFRATDPILDWPAPFGLNAGTPARAVVLNGAAYDFASWDFLNITASGLVRDKNVTFTGPEGENDTFRGLTVYSLIGIWSSSATEIVPIGTTSGGSTPAFNIGAAATLNIPSAVNAYLFLAENDGLFYDNLGSYNVNIIAETVQPTLVPIPAAFQLLLLALVGGVPVTRRSVRLSQGAS